MHPQISLICTLLRRPYLRNGLRWKGEIFCKQAFTLSSTPMPSLEILEHGLTARQVKHGLALT